MPSNPIRCRKLFDQGTNSSEKVYRWKLEFNWRRRRPDFGSKREERRKCGHRKSYFHLQNTFILINIKGKQNTNPSLTTPAGSKISKQISDTRVKFIELLPTTPLGRNHEIDTQDAAFNALINDLAQSKAESCNLSSYLI